MRGGELASRRGRVVGVRALDAADELAERTSIGVESTYDRAERRGELVGGEPRAGLARQHLGHHGLERGIAIAKGPRWQRALSRLLHLRDAQDRRTKAPTGQAL